MSGHILVYINMERFKGRYFFHYLDMLFDYHVFKTETEVTCLKEQYFFCFNRISTKIRCVLGLLCKYSTWKTLFKLIGQINTSRPSLWQSMNLNMFVHFTSFTHLSITKFTYSLYSRQNTISLKLRAWHQSNVCPHGNCQLNRFCLIPCHYREILIPYQYVNTLVTEVFPVGA